MKDERIKEIIKQVLFNPQTAYPAISYKITDVASDMYEDYDDSYTSQYIDIEDFKLYLERLEKQLVSRLTDTGV
jgi:SPX domain protein involved in polyphosphate accumulation